MVILRGFKEMIKKLICLSFFLFLINSTFADLGYSENSQNGFGYNLLNPQDPFGYNIIPTPSESSITTIINGGNLSTTSPPYLYDDTTTIYFNETKLNDTIDDRGGGAYTAGSNLTLAGNEFSVDMTSLVNYLTSLFLEIGDNLDWGNLINKPANLDEDSTDDLTTSDLPLENKTISHCSNITGATSDLCTITGGGDFSFTDFQNSFDLNLSASGLINNASYLSTYNSTYDGKQNDIGADCDAGDFVKGVDDDGTLDCTTPAGGGDFMTSSFQGAFDSNLSAVDQDLNVNSSNFWDNLDVPLDSWLSTYNTTYDAKISFNNTNIAYINNSNTFTQNQIIENNLNVTNITLGGCTEVWNGTCSIKECPTTILIQC
jgi:hypothetical protein